MQVPKLQTVFFTVVVLLFAKVFVSVLLGYVDYFPPSFGKGFLVGRSDYFFGVYQYAFYAHLVFGPLALVLGTILISSGRRWIHSKWINHRKLGRVQAIVVILGVVPTGIVMAWPSFIGMQAGMGLLILALLTGLFMLIAVVKAMKHDFDAHQIWATRCYVLLLSPLILRIANGALIVSGLQTDWLLSLNNWISWLVPMLIYEYRHFQTASIVEKPGHTLKGAI